MTVPPQNYFAYLLRMWRTDDQGKWRATLQDPHTGKQIHFVTVESLFVFLKHQMGEMTPPDAPPSGMPEQYNA